MADVYVNSEELKLIATGMKTKATSIMESYQNEASSAILMGSECLQISGLDTTTLLNSFNKIFTNLGTRINTLADFLSTTVANEYDNTTTAIANEFNNNFANEIAGILGISVGTNIGSSGVSPWPDGEELDPGFTYPDKDTSSIGIPASWWRDGGSSSNEPSFVDKRMDPDFGYPKIDRPGTGTVTPTPSNPGTTTPGTGGSNPGGSTTTPGGNLGKLDPDFGYPKYPSTGGSTSTPGTTPGTGTTTPSTPSTNPGTSSGVATPWPDGVNLDPDFGYPRKENMSDNIIPKLDEIINTGSGTISGRPVYERPVQPKPTPEIMSNNVMR